MWNPLAMVKNMISQSKKDLQENQDVVYSHLSKRFDHTDKELKYLKDLLHAVLGIDEGAENSAQGVVEARRKALDYQRKAEAGLGSVMEDLPPPPAALTGRGR